MTFGYDGRGRGGEPRCALKRGKGREEGSGGRLLPFGSLNANLLFLHGKADAACAICGRLIAVHRTVGDSCKNLLLRERLAQFLNFLFSATY